MPSVRSGSDTLSTCVSVHLDEIGLWALPTTGCLGPLWVSPFPTQSILNSVRVDVASAEESSEKTK